MVRKAALKSSLKRLPYEYQILKENRLLGLKSNRGDLEWQDKELNVHIKSDKEIDILEEMSVK